HGICCTLFPQTDASNGTRSHDHPSNCPAYRSSKMPTLEITGASIIALGSFNPPLLSVDWFCSNGLVGQGDADAARARDDYVVTRQVTRFQTELAVLQVVENQLAVAAAGPVTPALADLVTSIFELLPHTPVSGIGLNFNAHYRIEDAET